MNQQNESVAEQAGGELLKDIINHLSEGVLVFDGNGRIHYANQQANQLIATHSLSLQQQNIFNLLYLPDESGTLVEAEQTALQKIQLFGGQLKSVEGFLITGNKDLLPIKFNMSPLRHEARKGFALFTFWDNSEQKRIEQKLQQRTRQLNRRTRQLNRAQEITNIGNWEWNLKTNELTWTDELFRVYGYEPGEVDLTFELAISHFHPEDAERVIKIIEHSKEAGTSFRYQTFIFDANAHMKRMEVYGSTTRNAAGEPSIMRGTAQDITQQWQQQETLRRSELLFRTIFQGAAIGILHLATDGAILKVNPAGVKIFGQAEKQLLNKSLNKLLGRQKNGHFQSQFQALVRGDLSQFQMDVTWKGKDGRSRWTNVTVSLLEQFQTEPLRAVAMVEDITARKKVEKELREVKRRLSQSQEKERLRLAQDLHDGPIQDLYAATFHLQALRRLAPSEEAGQSVDLVQEMFKKVTDTLRMMCGELRPPTLAPFGLEAAIRSHAEQFSMRYPDLSINLDLMEDQQQLPELLRITLFRMVQELLNNIAKHAEATQALIRFRLTEHSILLEVQDNGIGFEVPKRWITLAQAGHLGLVGLSERVEDVNGRLHILSTPQKGTLVRITAPRHSEEEEIYESNSRLTS